MSSGENVLRCNEGPPTSIPITGAGECLGVPWIRIDWSRSTSNYTGLQLPRFDVGRTEVSEEDDAKKSADILVEEEHHMGRSWFMKNTEYRELLSDYDYISG